MHEIILRHPGKIICVIGGAKSAQEDAEQVEADVWISANEHGIQFRECDYIVAMDERHGNGLEMRPYLRKFSEAPIISRWDYADIRLTEWPFKPRTIYSGLVAAWVASIMGGFVVLAGFDAQERQPGAIRKAQNYVSHIKTPAREVNHRMGVWPVYRPDELR